MKKNLIIGFLIIIIFLLGWMCAALFVDDNAPHLTCTIQDVQDYLEYKLPSSNNLSKVAEAAECASGIQATINYFNAHPSYIDLYIRIPTPSLSPCRAEGSVGEGSILIIHYFIYESINSTLQITLRK